MGLRPSVRNESSNNSTNARHEFNNEKATNMNSNNNKSNISESTAQPSSSSSSTTTSSPPQREAWTVRGQLLLNFHHVISRAINSPEMVRKCSEIAQDMSRKETNKNDTVALQQQQQQQQQQQHSMAEEYSAEADLIVSNKEQRDALVRNKSIAVGVCSFVALRSGRGLSSFIRKAIAKRSASYKFDKLPSSSWSANNQTAHHLTQSTVTTSRIANQQLQQQPTTLRKVFNLSIDLSISTTLTFLSASYIFIPRPSSYIDDMAQLPLVPGKSLYAEMVCPSLVKEYKHVLEQYGGRWPVSLGSSSSSLDTTTTKPQKEQQEKLTQEDVSLNIIRKFVENCTKRDKYERALLEERNAFSDGLKGTATAHNNNNEQDTTVGRLIRRITGSSRGKDSTSSPPKEGTKRKLGTISVPDPGVPTDIDVDLDVDVFSLVEDDDDERGRP